jgi:hypothetical protein
MTLDTAEGLLCELLLGTVVPTVGTVVVAIDVLIESARADEVSID